MPTRFKDLSAEQKIEKRKQRHKRDLKIVGGIGGSLVVGFVLIAILVEPPAKEPTAQTAIQAVTPISKPMPEASPVTEVSPSLKVSLDPKVFELLEPTASFSQWKNLSEDDKYDVVLYWFFELAANSQWAAGLTDKDRGEKVSQMTYDIIKVLDETASTGEWDSFAIKVVVTMVAKKMNYAD
jgi:hypothetical protein